MVVNGIMICSIMVVSGMVVNGIMICSIMMVSGIVSVNNIFLSSIRCMAVTTSHTLCNFIMIF